MTKRNLQAHSPESPPAWYWVKGLHDAHITLAEAFEFPFDYDRYTRKKNTYDRNCLTLTLDAAGAMFDTSVKTIRLYNYKYLSPDAMLEGHGTLWWIGDRNNLTRFHFEHFRRYLYTMNLLLAYYLNRPRHNHNLLHHCYECKM